MEVCSLKGTNAIHTYCTCGNGLYLQAQTVSRLQAEPDPYYDPYSHQVRRGYVDLD